MEQPPDDDELRWDVRSDQIDPDRWARAAVKASTHQKDAPARRSRWWARGAFFTVLVAILWMAGPRTAVLASLPFVLVAAGGPLLSRRLSVRAIRRHLLADPYVREPFTFIADGNGTREASQIGRMNLSWNHYQRAILDDDLVVLEFSNVFRLLPAAALTSGHSPAQAVEILASRIANAHAGSGPGTNDAWSSTILDRPSTADAPRMTDESLRWDVRSDQIDLDHFAQAYLKAQGHLQPQRSQQLISSTIATLVLIGIAAITGLWALIAGLFVGIYSALRLLRRPYDRSIATNLARSLRGNPYFIEPFTFVADPEGTRDASPSSSSSSTWSRYERVELENDQIVLVLANSTIRMLPSAALTSDHTPEQAVEILSSWIENANADSRAAGGST